MERLVGNCFYGQRNRKEDGILSSGAETLGTGEGYRDAKLAIVATVSVHTAALIAAMDNRSLQHPVATLSPQ